MMDDSRSVCLPRLPLVVSSQVIPRYRAKTHHSAQSSQRKCRLVPVSRIHSRDRCGLSPQQATQIRRKRTHGTSNDRSPNRGKILSPNFIKGERRRWGNPRGAVTRRTWARIPRLRCMSFLSADCGHLLRSRMGIRGAGTPYSLPSINGLNAAWSAA